MKPKTNYTKIGLVSNIILFILKLYFGLVSGSLALLSDALNSFTDILASFGIFIAVAEGRKKPDKDHPYGHYAAEPISSFIVAILAIILAFEIFKDAVLELISPHYLNINLFVFGVVIFTILLKSILFFYFKRVEKKEKGQAIKAYILDSKNDVLVSSVVLIGVLGAYFGFDYLDGVVALFLSGYIFKSAFDLGMNNLRFLMGSSPNKNVISKFRETAQSVKGVIKVKQVKAQYFGDTLHVDMTITVSRKLSIVSAHRIDEVVKSKIFKEKDVSFVSVHVEPD